MGFRQMMNKYYQAPIATKINYKLRNANRFIRKCAIAAIIATNNVQIKIIIAAPENYFIKKAAAVNATLKAAQAIGSLSFKNKKFNLNGDSDANQQNNT